VLPPVPPLKLLSKLFVPPDPPPVFLTEFDPALPPAPGATLKVVFDKLTETS
jgi:hypothetical protein